MLLSLALVGCGAVDSTGAIGDFGHVGYHISTKYEVDAPTIRDVALVTGHTLSFWCDLTPAGLRASHNHAWEIEHRVSPDDGAEIESGEGSEDVEDSPPGFELVVSEPGTYTIETRLRGETFDTITLDFEVPAALELHTFARAPYDEDFQEVPDGDTMTATEGTQLAFFGLPLDADGGRLLGDVETAVAGDPATSVVPGENVNWVNEEEVSTAPSDPTLYLIEPGDVTVTLADTVNPASASRLVTVTPATE